MADILKLYLKDIGDTKSTHEENMILYHKWKDGDMRAYDKLVRNFLYLVIKISNKYKSSKSSFDDTIASGNEYLLRGLNSYEESKGALAPYLMRWIEAGIVRFLKGANGSVHIPENVINTGAFNVSYHYLDQECEEGAKFEVADRVDEFCDETERINKIRVQNWLNQFIDMHRDILKMYHIAEYTVEEIANRYSITTTRIRQILANPVVRKKDLIQEWLDNNLDKTECKVTNKYMVANGLEMSLTAVSNKMSTEQKLRIKEHNKLLSSL